MGNCSGKGHAADDDDEDHKVDYSGGSVHVITSKESWDAKLAEASKDGRTVVVNFSASWCGPCRMMAPYYTELSLKYPAVMFLAVDVDELCEFSSSWDIRATPTFFFLRDKQQVDKLLGANKPELEKKVIAFAESTAQLL